MVNQYQQRSEARMWTVPELLNRVYTNPLKPNINYMYQPI
jgi:hypothetical protein